MHTGAALRRPITIPLVIPAPSLIKDTTPSAWYPSISCGPHPSAEVPVACPSAGAERACRCAPHHGGPRRLLLEREAPCR